MREDENNAIEKAIEEYLEFEKDHIVLYGNVSDILESNKVITKNMIKVFCDELGLHNKMRSYLYNQEKEDIYFTELFYKGAYFEMLNIMG